MRERDIARDAEGLGTLNEAQLGEPAQVIIYASKPATQSIMTIIFGA